jgi:hypothetical protein
MTATHPPPAAPEAMGRRRLGWRDLAPVLAFAAAPKCLLCAFAYVAGGAALLSRRPVWCGAEPSGGWPSLWPPLLGAGLGAVLVYWRHRRTRLRPTAPLNPPAAAAHPARR